MTEFESDPDYEVCLVAFLDVMGFQYLLNTRSGSEIKELLSTFRRVSEGDATTPTRSDEMRLASEVHAEIVSDAIVRTRTVETQYRVGALFWELIDLLHIQMECVARGILVRGAMTIGHMHIGIDFSGPVFGPGLVQAYLMEEQEVIFPRIALHEDVIEHHRSDRMLWREGHTYEDEEQYLSNVLCRDESGLHYVDYLRASLGEINGECIGWLEFLNLHKAIIENGLSESSNAKVRRKYLWLKNYHNLVLAEHLADARPGVTIDDGTLWEERLRDLQIEM